MNEELKDDKNEDVVLAIKMDPLFKEEFKILAEKNQLSMSAFARFLMQREIHDFKSK